MMEDAVLHEPSQHVVLVIEDDAALAALCAEYLGMMGYKVIALSPPIEFGGLFFAGLPSCVVVDAMLSGAYSGMEITTRLRDISHVTAPFIAMSGSAQMIDLAEHSGLFVAALPKPFDMAALYAAVRHAIVDADTTQPAD
jgi:DNA-binding response OmpR family regulator